MNLKIYLSLLILSGKMEYDDPFHPTFGNELLENDYKNMSQFKNLDKGFHKIRMQTKMPSGIYKNIAYEIYSSGDIRSSIRDAITGSYYPTKVGSKEEEQFFKVTISTGTLQGQRKNFYFKSPMDYERHMQTTLNPKTKEEWTKKQGTK